MKPTNLKETLWCLVLFTFFIVWAAPLSYAQDAPLEEDSVYYSLSKENDAFADRDKRYTSGVRLSTLRAEEKIPGVFRRSLFRLPFFPEPGKKRLGFHIGQKMFTSDDISQKNPPKDERPYAGWLYTGIQLTSDTGDRLDQFEITLGMVGDYSLAEETQTFFHDLLGDQEPQGWHTQLKNEPGIILAYQRKWQAEKRVNHDPAVAVDFSPHAGGTVGNIYTHLALGGMFRAGFNLPEDYGPPVISPSFMGSNFFVPSDSFGGYLFAGLEGRAVGRNIFLDGNTFRDSRSVDKKHLVGDIVGGVVFTFNSFRLAYTHVLRTKEFDAQDGIDNYGAVTITARF